jgi:diphosphomevalonate decarboxylase
MSGLTATGVACANIAFIKYWGDQDPCLRIPANGSISMNLGGLYTRTRVTFDAALAADTLTVNGQEMAGAGLERVCDMLHTVRQIAGLEMNAAVVSESNFPIGAGIASSASAFAALALAASAAAGLELNEAQLSRLARTGSGSACRSIPGGFVEWKAGPGDEDSYAFTIAPPEHWDLVDCIAVISQIHKETGSSQGHALAETSPLQTARVADAPRRLELCRQAIQKRDFSALAKIIELDSNMMHAVMMTSSPRLIYWQPTTLAVMQAVVEWRKKGLAACYTIDAGPNVHVICLADHAKQIKNNLKEINGVQSVLTAHPGGPTQILTDEIQLR